MERIGGNVNDSMLQDITRGTAPEIADEIETLATRLSEVRASVGRVIFG